MRITGYIKRLLNVFKSSKPCPIIVNNGTLPESQLLKDRKVLITGGTSGIGYAIAKACLKSGAMVLITGRNQEKLDKAVKDLRDSCIKHSDVEGYVLDVSNEKDIIAKLSQILKEDKWSSLDTLINNAGICGGTMPNVTPEEFDKILSTNLKGPFFLSQNFAKHLITNKIKGNILNISSSSSVRPAISAYNVSKWGINGLTLGLAKALIPYGITVNGLAPGPTATPMLLGRNAEDKNLSLPNSPLGRYIFPEEIAGMAVTLIGPLGKSIIGDTIFMTGGAGIITYDDINTSIEF